MPSLNDYIVFQITPEGEEARTDEEATFVREMNERRASWAEPLTPRPPPFVPGRAGELDKWCKMQLGDFMYTFGRHVSPGSEMIKDNVFAIREADVPG